VVWGQDCQEYKFLKKWSDLMPINVTVATSKKISLEECIIKVLVFTVYTVAA